MSNDLQCDWNLKYDENDVVTKEQHLRNHTVRLELRELHVEGRVETMRCEDAISINQERPSRRKRRCRRVGCDTGTIATGPPFSRSEFISKTKAFSCAPTRAKDSCFGPRQKRVCRFSVPFA